MLVIIIIFSSSFFSHRICFPSHVSWHDHLLNSSCWKSHLIPTYSALTIIQTMLRAVPNLHSHCHVLSQTVITSQLNYCEILLSLTVSLVSSSSNSPSIILPE